MRLLTSLERLLTRVAAAIIRPLTALFARVLGRGEHREWRKQQAEADARRRSGQT